jgi:uncharacterized protein YbaR (Trm112 family)
MKHDKILCCPRCKNTLDAHTEVGGKAEPADGNISICIYCGGVSTYADGATRLEMMTDTELESIKAADEKTYNTIKHAVELIKQRKPKFDVHYIVNAGGIKK